jgi:DNA-binding MarR family transcriptional regulator
MSQAPELQISKECLAGRIRILNRVVSKIFDEKLRPHGVRSSQINILVVVAVHGPLTPAQVSRRLYLEKSTLSRDLTRLIDRGWIHSNTEQGRRSRLEISHDGRELIRRLTPAWKQAQSEVKKVLGKSFTAEVYRVIEDLRSSDVKE